MCVCVAAASERAKGSELVREMRRRCNAEREHEARGARGRGRPSKRAHQEREGAVHMAHGATRGGVTEVWSAYMSYDEKMWS